MAKPGQAPVSGAAPAGQGFENVDSPGLARAARRRRAFTLTASALGHVALVVVLLLGHKDPPAVYEPPPMTVELVRLAPPQAPAPKLAEAPSPSAAPAKPAPPPKAEKHKPVKTPPRRQLARKARAPVPPDVEPLVDGEDPAGDSDADVSAAELASATGAGAGGGSGSGGGGGACDMVARLQAALRKDPMVHAALADAAAGGQKTIRVWRGDWVRHPGQDGAGLAALREAIMWEVGFAPKACRSEPVRGLIVISMADGPGSARVVMGREHWRWSDLLGLGASSDR